MAIEELIKKHCIRKIETRGDCYIVVSGCNSVEGDISGLAQNVTHSHFFSPPPTSPPFPMPTFSSFPAFILLPPSSLLPPPPSVFPLPPSLHSLLSHRPSSSLLPRPPSSSLLLPRPPSSSLLQLVPPLLSSPIHHSPSPSSPFLTCFLYLLPPPSLPPPLPSSSLLRFSPSFTSSSLISPT